MEKEQGEGGKDFWAPKGETLTQAEMEMEGTSWSHAGFASRGLALGSPSPCLPCLYQGLQHITGTRVGRQGREERAAARDQPSGSFLPWLSEGGGSCQRKWGRIKEGRKGQGQVKKEQRPNFSLQSPPHPGLEG